MLHDTASDPLEPVVMSMIPLKHAFAAYEVFGEKNKEKDIAA